MEWKTFLKAVKTVFKREGYEPEMLSEPAPKNLIKETYEVFRQAIDMGIADNDIPPAMRQKLDHDAFIFSGFKVHHELSEAGLALRDKDGKVKGYETFAHDVRRIHGSYNGAYLRAEYDFAVASSQMAAKWQDIVADNGKYDLQYRTAGDGRVREEHAAMHGITLPATDPFWREYYPPNGWRCRCTVVQVNKGKYPTSDSKEAKRIGEKATTKPDRFGNNKAAIFRFNPGMDEKLFPPKHPYGKVEKDVREKVENLAKENVKPKLTPEEKEAIYALPLEKQFNKVYTDKKSGYSVFQHQLVDEAAEDYPQVLAVAKAYAKEGNCKINPEVDRRAEAGRKKLYPGIDNSSNPDLATERYGYVDVKSPRNKNNIVRNANNACKQGGIAMITDLELPEELSKKDIALATEAIFSNKNVDQKQTPNYTANEVHWFVKGKLHIFNRPEKN